MSDTVLKIEKLENGFTVEVCDPEIMKANDDPKSKKPYQSPWKEYAFQDVAGVTAFVNEHLGSLKPPPDADAEYGAAFDKASEKDD